MNLTMAVLAIALLALSVAAQEQSDSQGVLALEKDWNTAYRRGDVAKMNNLLANDFIITIEDGRTFSKSGYIALNGNSTVTVEVSEMSDLKVRAYGDTAVIIGSYHEKGVSQGKPYEYHDRFTDVWMKTERRWQLIASHYGIPVKQ